MGILRRIFGNDDTGASDYIDFCLWAEKNCKRCPKCNELRHTPCDVNGNWNKYAEKHDYRKCVKCGFIYQVLE
jgi:hypothetical protein